MKRPVGPWWRRDGHGRRVRAAAVRMTSRCPNEREADAVDRHLGEYYSTQQFLSTPCIGRSDHRILA
ncbi:hypothetical protein FHS38_005279 [Streptomyces netropsis]|uniref:Uncharacterized protein n=1 Tax=Streptomyces netropsis TaxID=55404 RepID=A0A7W7PGL2_STRNE|nr:hypothetical protein [Streptomyces netropsis]